MTVVPHAEKARSTAESVVRVARESHLNQDLLQRVANAIKDCGRSGKTSLVCFDHNQEIFQQIKAGIITAAIGQDAFGQGHDPLIWLYNNLVTGEKLDEFIPCRLHDCFSVSSGNPDTH